MKKNYNLINGDCLIEMKNIESQSVNLILTDLPYGTTKCKWDVVIPFEPLWEQYKRIIKPNGVIVLTANQPFTSILISSNLDWHKYNWIWKKNKTTGFLLANYRPMKQTEDIVVFSPAGAAAASKNTGNMVYNPQGLVEKKVKKKNTESRLGKMLNQKHHLGPNNKLLHGAEYEQNFTNYPVEILEFPIENGTKHPTQKPVPLFEYLIKTYSNENDIVLDNTMGSGTTGIACLNTNRYFIGIEMDEEYFQMAKNRILEHEKNIMDLIK
jgi:site-specific DNA-methyltransferase (adenine-specific)